MKDPYNIENTAQPPEDDDLAPNQQMQMDWMDKIETKFLALAHELEKERVDGLDDFIVIELFEAICLEGYPKEDFLSEPEVVEIEPQTED